MIYGGVKKDDWAVIEPPGAKNQILGSFPKANILADNAKKILVSPSVSPSTQFGVNFWGIKWKGSWGPHTEKDSCPPGACFFFIGEIRPAD